MRQKNKEKNHRDFPEGVGWNTNISGMLELCAILINWLGNFIDRKIIKSKLESFLNPTKSNPKEMKIDRRVVDMV